ncbi:DMT family transporter [Streptomyces phaeoluteigriseus]|uniref:DMT family transporter n=1 Tax=Streptomyces phaeoluteigriseus TaxID=114686 RepID=A0ABY4Z614_9ACTN|nr:EamA family transporter [Streptomyces phaeoluteigriseus]USQ84003.1 DMT family transporter [Streptomyces phaeoluteigriseus]
MPNRTSRPTSARPAEPAPARRPHHPLRGGPAPILTACLLWGTTGTVSSFAPAGAPAAAIGCAGLALGGILLLLTSRGARSLPARCTRSERRLLLLGAFAVAGYPVTFYPAVARTGVAVATVIALGSAPVFAGLLAWLTGRARPTARWTGATSAAVLGCTLLVLGPRLTGAGTPIDLTGVLLATFAGLSYAVYALIGGRLITHGHESGAVMGALFGAAGLLVLPFAPFVDVTWLGTVRGAAVAGYLALFTVYVAYRLFGHGLRRTSASAATSLTLAEPAVAAVLGVSVLGERLPYLSWCGLAVLGLGLVLLAVPAKGAVTEGR